MYILNYYVLLIIVHPLALFYSTNTRNSLWIENPGFWECGRTNSGSGSYCSVEERRGVTRRRAGREGLAVRHFGSHSKFCFQHEISSFQRICIFFMEFKYQSLILFMRFSTLILRAIHCDWCFVNTIISNRQLCIEIAKLNELVRQFILMCVYVLYCLSSTVLFV